MAVQVEAIHWSEETLRRIMNGLTAARASAQLLERTADELPSEVRDKRRERLRAIVEGLDQVVHDVRTLADAAREGHAAE